MVTSHDSVPLAHVVSCHVQRPRSTRDAVCGTPTGRRRSTHSTHLVLRGPGQQQASTTPQPGQAPRHHLPPACKAEGGDRRLERRGRWCRADRPPRRPLLGWSGDALGRSTPPGQDPEAGVSAARSCAPGRDRGTRGAGLPLTGGDADESQAAHALRGEHGQARADHAAHGEAHHVRRPPAQLVLAAAWEAAAAWSGRGGGGGTCVARVAGSPLLLDCAPAAGAAAGHSECLLRHGGGGVMVTTKADW
jgi:hypothetical protein